jgi:tetratricopeptide (TPR) repeat protein
LNNSERHNSTLIRRVLPFWLIAVLAAAVGVTMLYLHGIRLINYIQYPETNPLQLAETYRVEGQKAYHEAAKAFARMKDDPARPTRMKNLPALQKARMLFLESLKLKPNMPGIYVYLSDLVAFEDDTASMYYYRGRQAMSENYASAALEDFDQALKLKGDFHPAQLEKIRALITLGRIADAHQSMDDLFKGAPNDPEVLYLKAELAAQEGKTQEYRTALEEALKAEPGHLMSAKAFGSLLTDEKQYDRAISVFKEARKVHPRDANLLHRLGCAYYLKGDLAQARETLEAALKLEKNSAPLYFDLACVYEKMGKKSHATAMLQKAIEIDPAFKNRILFPDVKY